MSDIEKRGRGRPKKDKSMQDQFIMRMDTDMTKRLDDLCKITGMSKADIFRESFSMYEKLKLIQRSNEVEEDNYDDFAYFEDDFDGEFYDDKG